MIQRFRNKLLIFFFCLTLSCASLSACQAPAETNSSSNAQKERRSFDEYADEIFVREMQENTVNLHYTVSDPESFGIKSHKISLGSCSKEHAGRSAASVENMIARLSEFDYDSLGTTQKLTYDILTDYCERAARSSEFYYYEEPLSPTTGTQSELPVLLAEYAFYDSCDVTDYLALLTCVEDYFQEIAVFEQEKAKEGLFMPSYAAETVIESCLSFAKNPDENYLIDTFNSRIEKTKGLSQEKKELYKRQNLSLVQNSVIPAYEKLADTLTELKDAGTNNAGLCHYPKGKRYYESLVRHSTGSDKSIEELKEITEKKRERDMAALRDLLASDPGLLETGEPKFSPDQSKEILEHLKIAMREEFYPAANGSYEVNFVHESLEHALAPAFYLTAPIDDASHNVIYLNKQSQYSGMQLFTTLAHEGFPGHLYQTTESYRAGLAPVRAILNYPGYVEGWATYVEMLSYRYAGLSERQAELMMRNQSATLSLYATIDMGVHYDGWTFEDALTFLNGYGISNKDTARDIFELIAEEPAHYLKYYIGYLEFLELKEYAKQEFGESYSDRAFHQAVIRIGPAPFSLLKSYLKQFYSPES